MGGKYKGGNGSKSSQSKAQGAARKSAQQQRGSGGFKGGSNVHNGAARSQSGTSTKR